MELTKQQIKDIIQKAPQGTTPQGILSGLRDKGYTFEGYPNQETPNQSVLPERSKLDTAKDFGEGVVKGGIRSVINLANIIPSAIEKVTGVTHPVLSRNRALEEKVQPSNEAQRVGGYVETAGEFIIPGIAGKQVIGESLINQARRIYQSALKPSTTLNPAEKLKIVDTGLREAVNISQKGVEKLGEKITQLESALDAPIKEATAKGAKILVETLKPYIEDAKRILGKTADPLFSERAVQSIERRFEALRQKYPEGIPLDVAQELKTNTYQLIKKAYGKLSTSANEFQKQVARGLKDKIVEGAPIVGEINSRLKNLYAFEKEVERAANRITNRDIVGLGTKVLASAQGLPMKTIAIVNELLGPTAKSFNAIQLNKLGQKLVSKSTEELRWIKELAKYVAPMDLVNLISGKENTLKPRD